MNNWSSRIYSKISRKTIDHLKETGFSENEISRINGLVGLEIGANTPSEIALSIIAEIVKVKYGQREVW